jgi:hypothetical protein
MNQVIETVSFKLAAGTDIPAFLASNEAINTWVKTQAGFMWRKLCLHDDGTWLDVVQWRSMDDALLSAQKMMDDIGQSPFMAMIDPESIMMRHGHLHISA